MPTAEAPGKLKNRDDRKLVNTDKEKVPGSGWLLFEASIEALLKRVPRFMSVLNCKLLRSFIAPERLIADVSTLKHQFRV